MLLRAFQDTLMNRDNPNLEPSALQQALHILANIYQFWKWLSWAILKEKLFSYGIWVVTAFKDNRIILHNPNLKVNINKYL